MGNLNCLEDFTRIDLTPVVGFLLTYNHHPSPEHLKLELYSLQYTLSTSDLSVHFTSDATLKTHEYVHFPFLNDKEVYIEAI